MKAIQATNVSYTSGSTLILDKISIESESKKITALLGHNGSGKSTFIDILCGTIKPQKGEVNILNSSFSKEKKKIGVVWDNPVLFPMLKVKEIVRFCMKIYNLNKLSEEYYHILELGKIKDRFYYQLSKGEKKRVAIYMAVMHNPSIIILDEPTSDLDPIVREKIWNNILKDNSRTIFFTTHLWDEAEKYADKVYFIHQGKILQEPNSPRAFIENCKYKQKIILPKKYTNEIDIKDSTDFKIIEDDNNYNLLVDKNVDEVINKVSKYTSNFTVLPIELKDVYQFIIN